MNLDPIVITAFITGLVGIVTGLMTIRATRMTEETKQKQADNAATLSSVEVRLNHWTELVDSLHEEITRLERQCEIERGRNEALQETIDSLRGKKK